MQRERQHHNSCSLVGESSLTQVLAGAFTAPVRAKGSACVGREERIGDRFGLGRECERLG